MNYLNGIRTPLVPKIRSILGLPNSDYPAALNQMLQERLVEITETVNKNTHLPAILLTTESLSMQASRPAKIIAMHKKRLTEMKDRNRYGRDDWS